MGQGRGSAPLWQVVGARNVKAPKQKPRHGTGVTVPAVPSFNDPEFVTALSALVQGAKFLKELVGEMARDLRSRRLLLEHAETALLAETVIQQFEDHVAALCASSRSIAKARCQARLHGHTTRKVPKATAQK